MTAKKKPADERAEVMIRDCNFTGPKIEANTVAALHEMGRAAAIGFEALKVMAEQLKTPDMNGSMISITNRNPG